MNTQEWQEVNFLINKVLAGAPEVGILAAFYEARKYNLASAGAPDPNQLAKVANKLGIDAQSLLGTLGTDAAKTIAGLAKLLGV